MSARQTPGTNTRNVMRTFYKIRVHTIAFRFRLVQNDSNANEKEVLQACQLDLSSTTARRAEPAGGEYLMTAKSLPKLVKAAKVGTAHLRAGSSSTRVLLRGDRR